MRSTSSLFVSGLALALCAANVTACGSDSNAPGRGGPNPGGGTTPFVCAPDCPVTNLVRTDVQPVSLAVHGDYIYFAAYGSEDRRGIYSVPTSGGAPTQLANALVSASAACKLVATDGAHVYYVNGSMLERVPVTGGPTEELAPATAADSDARCVALDETSVFWLGKPSGQGGVSAGLMRMPKQGGPVSTVALPEVVSFVIRGDVAYLGTNNEVMAVPKLGGTPVVLAGQLVYGTRSVDSDGAFVYVGDHVEDSVFRVSVEGGAPETLASDQAPYGLLVDGSILLWAHRPNAAEDNRLMAQALPNGVAIPFAKTVGAVDLAVDAKSIYWASYSEKAIRQTAR